MRASQCLALLVLFVLPLGAAFAQDAPPGLAVESVQVTPAINAFGQPVFTAEGVITNTSGVSYSDVFLTARAFDAAGEQIAEGYGYLVDACGAGLLPGSLIPPGHAQPFSAPLEFFTELEDPASQIERLEVDAQATPTDAPLVLPLAGGITRLSDQEVVQVEWLDNRTLRYAIGCPRDLFVDWTWRQADLDSGRDTVVQHPDAALVTNALRERLGLTDPALFANSRLSFSPHGGRLVYQDGVNRFYTAADNGDVQRLLFTRLNNRVLQSIEWLDDDRFLASYYGAAGEPVLWFTADAEGRTLSPSPNNNPPSITLPGVSRDGRRVIIGGTFDTDAGTGVTGYYLNVVTNGFFELLFAGDVPDNNYPPPVPVTDPVEDIVARVYVVRPAEGAPLLQCFNRSEGALYDLAALPPALVESDRSGLWLSPDATTLALTATGLGGGLWLIDLTALPACEAG